MCKLREYIIYLYIYTHTIWFYICVDTFTSRAISPISFLSTNVFNHVVSVAGFTPQPYHKK